MKPWFFRAYRCLLGMVFVLISLGAAVRAMDAGLACPDWPLCFGDVIPDFHPQVYFEFIHRVLAGLVALLTVTLHITLIRSRSAVPKNLRTLAGFSILLLLLQVVMGGLTVLLQLHEEVVAAHLSLGTAFFGVLVWIYMSLRAQHVERPALELNWVSKYFSYGALGSVYMQIVLGGFVASHYAALVCTDFPTCHGKLIPTFDGIIGLHVIHRLGAYALTVVLACFAIHLLLNKTDAKIRSGAIWMIALICVQITLGVTNVLFMRPPLITVLHLATGTAILGLTVYLNRQLRFAPYSASA
jgi:heme a synthase